MSGDRLRFLLEKCETLYGYAHFVAEIRKNLEIMELKQAVELAVEECIRKDILKDFLIQQRAEVVAMSIYEYNEEYVRKSFFEDGEKSGYDRGKTDGEKSGYDRGKVDGEDRLGKLISMLLKENELEEISIVSSNAEAGKEYFEKYHI